MTLAGYAHRGAYTLIASALLAGLFVLVALRPESPSARRPLVRALVVLWVAQNVFLVASCILRTLDYVEVYSLTRLRIAALIWMGLVGVGLMLICWRMLRGKSSSWLINANVAAAGFVLSACTVVDTGAVAAAWNVRHAREVGGEGAALDVCYLGQLGDSALISLAELQQRPLPPSLLAKISWERAIIQSDLEQRQRNWRAWSARGMRRLERAQQLPNPKSRAAGVIESCDDDDAPLTTPSAIPVPGANSPTPR